MQKRFIYYQINVTNKNNDILYINKLKEEGFYIIGIEVTDEEIDKYCNISIDPQHSFNNQQITAIEYVFNNQIELIENLKQYNKILIITVRTDIDSIGAMSVLTSLIVSKFELDGDMILRLKAIARSDRHGRENWKQPKDDYFYFKNYNIYGLPSGLACMTSDYKIKIQKKVKWMTEYLKFGMFKDINKYNDIANKNLEKSNKGLKLKILIEKKLCFVESTHRSGISHGYKKTPCVIAKNNKFIFGKGRTRKVGKKITIAQYENNKFINLVQLGEELNKLEQGWGGSKSIIGSPQDRPSQLKDEVIINLTKNCMY